MLTSRRPYSPKLVEKRFPEVRLQGVLQNSQKSSKPSSFEWYLPDAAPLGLSYEHGPSGKERDDGPTESDDLRMRPPLPYRGREGEERQACQMPELRGARPREGVRGGDDACDKGRGEVPGQGGI